MGIVHTLIGARPPARADGEPFVSVTIREASAEAGPFTDLTTIALDPIDADPGDPQDRDFTFESDLAQAWFRLIFTDTDGDTSPPSDPVFDDAEDTATPWAPTVEEVAALIRARTKVAGGVELGTFRDPQADPRVAGTRPTASEVRHLISQAVRRVQSELGGADPCSRELREDARGLAAIRAAMMVEQSYYPEQTTAAGSSFQSLRALWRDDIGTLRKAVDEECGSGSAGPGDATPRARFDDAPLIGRSFPRW